MIDPGHSQESRAGGVVLLLGAAFADLFRLPGFHAKYFTALLVVFAN